MQGINNNIYYIYILECSNRSYYTGYARDIDKRISEHFRGTANAKYTRSFRPVNIAQVWEIYGTRADAMKVEAFIKKQDRKFKDQIVKEPGKLANIINERLNLDYRFVILSDDRLGFLLGNK